VREAKGSNVERRKFDSDARAEFFTDEAVAKVQNQGFLNI